MVFQKEKTKPDMKKLLSENVYYRRLIYVLAAFVLTVVVVAFLNYQTDDEIYVGAFDYTGYPEDTSFEDGVLTVDERAGLKAGDVMAEIPAMHLDAGTFTFDIDHQSENDFEAIIYDGNTELARINLTAGELNTRYTYSSDRNLYNLKVDFIYNGTGYNTVKRTVIYSEKGPFYTDTICFALIVIITAVMITIMLIKNRFFEQTTDMKLYYGVMVLYSVYINYPFMRPYVPAGGDIGYHVARTEGIFNGLLQGQFPVGLYTDVMHGRGMISAMYPHLFFVIPAVLRLLHVSMEAAFRVFYMCMNLATCVTSYHAGKVLSGNNKKLSLLTMILYCILPYRVTTMSWRFAYGETLAFIFLPLVISGLYEIILGDRRRWYILTIGMTGLIECHLLSAIQGALLCLIFGMLFIFVLIKEKRILQVLLAAISTILLNIWFIAPFLYYYKSDILTTYLGTGDMAFISYFWSDMLQFLPNTTVSDQMVHQMGIIGIGTVLFALVSIYLLFVRKEYGRRELFSAVLLLIALIFIFAASKDFPWRTLEKFEGLYAAMSKFQFSGRFYMLGEGLIIFGGIMIISDAGAFRYRKAIIMMTIIATMIQSFLISDTYINLGKMFRDAKEMRYMPNIADAMEYDFYAPEAYDEDAFPLEIQSPSAEIEAYYHEGLYTGFKYRAEKDTYADVPLTYYLGFIAKDPRSGETVQVSQGDVGNIRLSLPASKEWKEVLLVYEGYEYQDIMTIISILSFICFIITIMHYKGWLKWKRS